MCDTAFDKHLLSLELKRQNKCVNDQICIWFLKLFCIIQQNVNHCLNIRLHFKDRQEYANQNKRKATSCKVEAKGHD
jgi:hypothetical protein